ncbi:Transcriptional regulator of ribosomal biogenesis proteins [Podila epigama]|nr:Transcriptional regulator of ribosomal biogenesis proteins [Podila epigama]
MADNARTREFETAFCRDFNCCGLVLVDLHDLLQHYEECHVRFEEDEDELSGEHESEFFDEDGWSDSDSAPSSPSSSSAHGSGSSSSGRGSQSGGSTDTASLNYPLRGWSRSTQSPMHHHHHHHHAPHPFYSPDGDLIPSFPPYHNPTTHALEAFSAVPNKRKAVVSLADIYSEDDHGDGENGDNGSAFSNAIVRTVRGPPDSTTAIPGPLMKRQAVESSQRSQLSDGTMINSNNNNNNNKMGLPNGAGQHPFNSQNNAHNHTHTTGYPPRPNNGLGLAGHPHPHPHPHPQGAFPGPGSNDARSGAGPQPSVLNGLLNGRPLPLFLTPGGTPANTIELLRQRDEVFSMIEDMSKPNNNNSGDKPYRCTVQGCDKSYKNPNGLKYHNLHGHCSSSGMCGDDNPENKPYLCTFLECGKRYKNLNGLKYHIEHSHPNLIAALRAHQSGLTNPLLFGPYPNQAAMTIAAALAAVESTAAANAANGSSSSTPPGTNGTTTSTTATAGPASSSAPPSSIAKAPSAPNGVPGFNFSHGPTSMSIPTPLMQAPMNSVSIAPAMPPLVRTIKDVAVPIGTVTGGGGGGGGGILTAVPHPHPPLSASALTVPTLASIAASEEAAKLTAALSKTE